MVKEGKVLKKSHGSSDGNGGGGSGCELCRLIIDSWFEAGDSSGNNDDDGGKKGGGGGGGRELQLIRGSGFGGCDGSSDGCEDR